MGWFKRAAISILGTPVVVAERIMGVDVEGAAMEALWPLPRVLPGPWSIRQKEIDHANQRVSELRAWVESSADLSLAQKSAYLGWLNFCEHDNRRAQKSLDTNEAKRFDEKCESDHQKRSEARQRANIPKPPTR